MRYESEIDLGQVTLDDVGQLVEACREVGGVDLDLSAARLKVIFEVGQGLAFADLWDLHEIIVDELSPQVEAYGGRWLQQKPLPLDQNPPS